MARVASFTATGPSGVAGGGLLRAMQERRQELAARQAQLMQPEPIQSWTQGAANLANIFTTGMQQRRVAQDEAQGREALARAVAGVDMNTGQASPDQLGVMMQMDPEVGFAFVKQAIESRRAAAEQARADAQRLEERGWSVADQQAAAAAANANREDQQAFTAGQTDKQLAATSTNQQGQQAATAALQEDQQAAAVEAARLKAEQEAGKPTTDQGKIIADFNAGAYGDPATPGAQKLRDDAIKKANTASAGIQLISPETGAKIGLIDEFLNNYDMVERSASAGEMTGPVDLVKNVMMGRGPGGQAYRMLRQGTEGLVRIMTGAGMPESEARDRVRQYEPEWTDDANTLVSKIQGLKAAVTSARQGATYGRNAPAEPGSGTELSDDDLVKKYGG